ncbi:BTAD domain-containing putative transcriptional regulator [Sphingomonas sp.]|uniref:AfsR/SARP family transcriptional regulator n=1 Tax=Sphingomonas sp. TaxID=28214 RepID=UPI001D982740|nr:BTAD domain-containing putative transcriptional regulator [Sphingomonas sp.]MBX9797460.1 hypothetical protein [Sphingomonas sp.]
MVKCRVFLLGDGAVHMGGAAVPIPAACWPILGFVATQPRREASRARLAGMLWPGMLDEAARRCLATALWRLKAAFQSSAMPLSIGSESVAIPAELAGAIDIVRLEWHAGFVLRARALPGTDYRRRAIRLLLNANGDFLSGIDAEWAALERERLRCLRLDALYALARFAERAGDWAAVIDAARPICAAEPLREDAQRLLIAAYARTGNRGLALRQYNACQDALMRELGITPMPETAALAEALHGSGLAMAPGATPAARSALLKARRSMQSAITLVDQVLGTP